MLPSFDIENRLGKFLIVEPFDYMTYKRNKGADPWYYRLLMLFRIMLMLSIAAAFAVVCCALMLMEIVTYPLIAPVAFVLGYKYYPYTLCGYLEIQHEITFVPLSKD